MKPIYFPFTYISEPVVEATGACFKQLVVYQPSNQKVPENMQKWAKSGILDIRVPVKSDEKELDAALRDYKTWVNIHQGSEMSFFKTLGETIPFFDESSVSRIRADIKKKSRETQSPKNSDHLFNAGLFLQIAQEFDMQSWEISKDLQFCENMEIDLIKKLKGENDTSYKKIFGNIAFKTHDPGSFMIPERIKAWTYLMDYDQAQHNHEIPGLFITSSRAAVEHLIDKAPDAKKLFCFDTIPVHQNRAPEVDTWRDALMQHLDMLAENEWAGSIDGIDKTPADQRCEKKISLTLYIMPREAPREFFSRCIEHKLARPREKNQRSRFKNTIIGLIET